MPETTLADLLRRNEAHVSGLPSDHYDAVQDGQEPAAVSICCADSRVPQQAMWDVTEPGWLFTPSTIGNQVWDSHQGEQVVDGSVLYPMSQTNTAVTIVVGHTGCGAVTAAYQRITGASIDLPPGIDKWVALLEPVIEAGLEDPRIDEEDTGELIDQLVEYNVDRQIEFLADSADVPPDESLFGFVYDLHGSYGGPAGRTYLVNVDGETARHELESLVPNEFADAVDRLVS